MNAASLWGSTLITSVLGFGFWIAAARLFPIASVGVASAAISAMTLLAQFGLLGMGTLLIGELAGGDFAVGLVSAATLLAGGVSFGLGFAFVALQGLISTKLGPLGHGVVGPLLFASGAGITAITLVTDQAVVGLNRGGLQLARNGVFSAVKLVLLPVGALLAPGPWALVLYGAWTGGNVVSLLTFWLHARRSGIRPVLAPAFRPLWAVRKTAFYHHWLNLASQVRPLLLPVIVSATLSSAKTAAFYEANLIVSFVAIIPAHMSTALFALPRGSYDRLARELRATLRVSFGVVALAAVFFIAFSYPILLVFGRRYTVASTPMGLLALSAIPFTVQAHYAAVERVRGKLMHCAAVFSACGVFETAVCILGVKADGLIGVSVGLDISLGLEALLLWPTVARAARVPVLGIPTWLWRNDGGSIAVPQRDPVSVKVLSPGDPRFMRYREAAGNRSAGSAIARGRARLTMAASILWIQLQRRRVRHERISFSAEPISRLLPQVMMSPAPRFIAARSLIAVLDLTPSRGVPGTGGARPGSSAQIELAERQGVRVLQLHNPAAALAAYGLVSGRAPTRAASEEPELRGLLNDSTALAFAAVDPADIFLCVALAVSDGAEGFLMRLVSIHHEHADGVRWMVHASVCSRLRDAGVERVWSEGPLTVDPETQMFQRRLGYQCATFETTLADG